MKHPALVRLGIIFMVLGALIPAPANTLAQSNVNLAVHFIEGAPLEDEIAYYVNAYLSVVGGTGIPIRDLTVNSLTVTEDSQKVEIQDLSLVEDVPIHIVFVMDTSGSMTGPKIRDAKTAASNFISRLEEDDRAALLTFDENIKLLTEFTDGHSTAIDRIALIDATPNAGTCLYDAAYQAVQLASTLPSGRRAVVLFTDGVDETSTGGRACSVHTIEDVINIASEGGTRAPIYPLGLGNRIDENTLKRIAELTGGRYIYSPDSSQLETMFQLLSEQLRFQYVLTYKSFAAPGAHTLAVNINHLGTQDSDTRNFLLPALPARINFLTPAEGETVTGVVKTMVNLSGQGETVDRVDFEINGKVVGMDDTTPYDLEIDMNEFETGMLTLSAIAYGEDQAELARSSINLVHAGIPVEPAIATAKPSPVPPASAPQRNNTVMMIGLGLGGLGFVTIILLGFLLVRQRKQEQAVDKGGGRQGSAVSREDGDADRTMGSWESRTEALGALTVKASDDPSMIGLRFEISSSLTTLGRSADNDINFPKDNPVSRRHAEIFEAKQKLFLREVEAADASGKYKPPKYGTFVNEIPLGSEPVGLTNGDEIRLGKRVRLKFETHQRMMEEDSLTYDDMALEDDPDKTMDQY